MEFEKLTAEIRSGRKKGVARQLRRSGKIPGVCYGRELDPIALSLDPKSLSDVVRGPLGRNAIIEMTVTGEGAPSEPILCMLQDFQYHPVRREVLHADFIGISPDREVRVHVPFEVTGRSIGVQAGGVLTQVFRELPVRCLPANVPAKLSVDVTNLDVGGMLKVSDVAVPEGVEIEYPPTQTLVNVIAPTVSSAAASAEEGEEEAAAPAAAEEAAESPASE